MENTEKTELHPIFKAIEDFNYENGIFEYKMQVLAEIIERLYRLPVMKVMFLYEVVYDMTQGKLLEPDTFEISMTEVLNRISVTVADDD